MNIYINIHSYHWSWLFDVVRQDNQSETSLPSNSIDTIPFDQFPNEGQALSGPFKVPSDVLRKQSLFGNCTKNLIIDPPKVNILEQKRNYSCDGNNPPKVSIKEKRKPTVNKNSKPMQQVIYIWSGCKQKKINF